MLPIPTPSALAAFVGCVAMLSIGLGTASSVTTALAGGCFVGLALALGVTMPIGRRVRRQRLEFAWWLGHGDPAAGGGAVVPGAPFEVRCYIRHRGPMSLLLSKLSPIVPGGATVKEDEPTELVLAARSRTEFSFTLIAPAAGRVVLHGLSVTLRGPLGLFEVPLYFPNPLAIKVLPRAARLRSVARLRSSLGVDRSGRNLLRRRGGGTELHELRELSPGDPFKSIAWKASARAGKLMVREVEQEVQETRVLVLDVSGTMRGGPPGSRKLDFAIEAAAAEARKALDEGDRFGLVTVDGRVLSFVPPRDGATHMIRIYDALLSATEVVDQDLTDVTDDEVIRTVGRYVRNQDGVDFSMRTGTDDRWDVPALLRHVRRSLDGEHASRDIVAGSPTGANMRAFCQARGIPLPYRPAPEGGTKAPGLADALQRASGKKREPASLMVITDFDGAGDIEPLLDSARLAKSRGHAMIFIVPDAQSFAPAPTSTLEADLRVVYQHGESRRLRDARTRLGRMGIPVVSAGERHPGTARRSKGPPRREVA